MLVNCIKSGTLFILHAKLSTQFYCDFIFRHIHFFVDVQFFHDMPQKLRIWKFCNSIKNSKTKTTLVFKFVNDISCGLHFPLVYIHLEILISIFTPLHDIKPWLPWTRKQIYKWYLVFYNNVWYETFSPLFIQFLNFRTSHNCVLWSAMHTGTDS